MISEGIRQNSPSGLRKNGIAPQPLSHVVSALGKNVRGADLGGQAAQYIEVVRCIPTTRVIGIAHRPPGPSDARQWYLTPKKESYTIDARGRFPPAERQRRPANQGKS